ncbi:MAG: hypothetical protein FWD76_06310 [Firmicutes bacterium]|nr:hypothetical protein [Bacillota bacterium]
MDKRTHFGDTKIDDGTHRRERQLRINISKKHNDTKRVLANTKEKVCQMETQTYQIAYSLGAQKFLCRVDASSTQREDLWNGGKQF